MTDGQVPIARKIVFTTLALVVFWVVAWTAYGMGLEDAVPIGSRPHIWRTSTRPPEVDVLRFLRENASLCLAVVPALLLSVAIYRLPRFRDRADQRERRMLISIILFIASIEVCYRVGKSDTSRLWPFLPIVLTTAFVIHAAWRSAPRDVEIEGADEDEPRGASGVCQSGAEARNRESAR